VVSGLSVRVREFGRRRRRGLGREVMRMKRRGNRRVLEAARESGAREAWWGVKKV